MQITRYKEVDSTNAKIKGLLISGKIKGDTVIMADFQKNGRGQGQKYWHSQAGKNLLMSFCLNVDLPVQSNFRIIMAISYLMKMFLANYNIPVSIKWPNDIYAGNKKLAGILIENNLKGSSIYRTIIGVGLNVNQLTFPEDLPNPVSMMQLTDNHYKREELLEELAEYVHTGFNFLIYEDNALEQVYTNALYQLNEIHEYRTNNGMLEGKITGVKTSGELLIEDREGKEHSFLHGEVEYLVRGGK